MATPISKTWLELQNLSGGTSCKQIIDLMAVNYPGYTDATAIDIKTWGEQLRAAHLIHLAYHSAIRLMTGAQQRTFVVWLLNELSSHLPVGWAKTAAVQAKIVDIIDCITAPTAGKKAALQAYASSLTIDFTDEREVYLLEVVKKICNLLVSGGTDHSDVSNFTSYVTNGFMKISGLSKDVVFGALLDEIYVVLNV